MLADTNVYSDFDTLAAFSGEPGQFWPRLRAYAQATFLAQGSCLLVQAQTDKAQAEYRLLFQKVAVDYATGTLKTDDFE